MKTDRPNSLNENVHIKWIAVAVTVLPLGCFGDNLAREAPPHRDDDGWSQPCPLSVSIVDVTEDSTAHAHEHPAYATHSRDKLRRGCSVTHGHHLAAQPTLGVERVHISPVQLAVAQEAAAAPEPNDGDRIPLFSRRVVCAERNKVVRKGCPPATAAVATSVDRGSSAAIGCIPGGIISLA